MAITVNRAAADRFITAKKRQYSDEEIGKILRGVAIRAYNDVVRETPQWSGHMASNVTISIDGTEEAGTNKLLSQGTSKDNTKSDKGKGDSEARGIADSRNSWVNSHKVGINSKITIGYLAEPLNSYYDEVEAGMSSEGHSLRSVNRPGQALARAYAKVPTKINNYDAYQYSRDKI